VNISNSPPPSLSVVLVAASGAASVARTISHLRKQSVRQVIEFIVVVANERELDGLTIDDGVFHTVRVVSTGTITARGAAAAEGIAHATAPIVGLIEDHSFPEPEWAESLIRSHNGPWAAVGPVVGNANPDDALSWVNFVLTYAAFSPPQQSGPREMLPWHNSSYKRELLLPYADRLGELFSWEGTLQQELCRNGHRLYLDSTAQTSHANVSRFGSTLRLNVQRGRIMGGLRAQQERWPVWRKWIHAAAFPLYPFMQARFVIPGLRRQPMSARMRVNTFCMLVPTLTAMAVGEARGIFSGIGNALHLLEDYELHRLKHIPRKEREEILEYFSSVKLSDHSRAAASADDVQSESPTK